MPTSREKTKRGASSKRLVCPLMSEAETAAVTVPYERVGTELPRIMAEYGFAIVTGCVDEEGCEKLEKNFTEDLSALIDVNEAKKVSRKLGKAAEAAAADASKFPLASLDRLGDRHRCQLHGLPHGQFAWACRLHPNVKHCFQMLHPDAAELISSCDNPFFSPTDTPEENENRNWPHVDQNSNDYQMGDMDVYQGLLYVWPGDSTHASTTVVLPRSHNTAFEKIMADPNMVALGKRGSHFSMVERMCPGPVKKEIIAAWKDGACRCSIPAGALLLWSSKTLHQGWTGGPRLAQPVCWEPADRRPPTVRERKLRLAALGFPSTHSASQGLPHHLVAPARPERAGAGDGGDKLPVRDICAMASLADGVSLDVLWDAGIGTADWKCSLSPEMAALVERSVAAEVAAVL